MVDLPLDDAQFIGLLLGIVLYGIYLCLSVLVLWVAWSIPNPNRLVFGALSALFLLSTCTVVFWMVDDSIAFLWRADGNSPQGAILYLAAPSNKIRTLKVLFTFLSTYLADLLFATRLFVVWDRRMSILIVPALLFVVGAVSGISVVAYTFLAAADDSSQYDELRNVWGIVAFATSVVFNVLVTSLISGRMWVMGQRITGLNARSERIYTRVMNVIIDSGVVYTLTLLTFMVLAGCGMDGAQNLMFYIVPMTVAIMPTLLVLRLHLGESDASRDTATIMSSMEFSPPNDEGQGRPVQCRVLRELDTLSMSGTEPDRNIR